MEFEEYLHQRYGDKSCVQSNSGRFWNWPKSECFLGVPPDKLYGRESLRKLPRNLKGLHIYLGSDCEDLINAFSRSVLPNSIERLSIGDSSYALGTGRNYEKISEILSGIKFPRLKVLEYGVWELFSNSHCLFGNLGNITGLLRQMPNLEHMSLYGAFELNTIMSFSQLKSFNITLDDYVTRINGGLITQQTLNNILESNYPSLEETFIDLECDENDRNYTIPEKFLSGINVPSLKKVEFTGGYKEGEIEYLQNSPFVKDNDVIVIYEKPE